MEERLTLSERIKRRREAKEKQSKGYWRAPKQEKEIAKRINGRKVPGSGSGKTKGDVRVHSITRIECKTTQNKSFSVTREMIDKIVNAGIGCDEIPAIVVEFLCSRGNREMEVAVIPFWALEQLILRCQSNAAATEEA